ncbi:MAG TPA: plastocyanin/azurin family copper-binding protein [Polyangia bacterium]|nr:plastocyanin/azurin family copper-binding protein [Polyangia bacterium]
MSHRLPRLSAAAFSIVMAASGCGGSPAANEIDASDALTFSPSRLSVVVGTTVHWRNTGSALHTVTSGASSKAADSPGAVFDSPLSSGGTFDFTFTTVGDQPYFCRFHESMGMTGVVTVTAIPTGGGY